MEITTQTFLLLLSMAFACEFIDSAAGMGYGTILAPLLIALGFAPHAAVPAVLISQAFGGLAASIFHHRFENVSFARDSRDLKVVLVISALGIVATIAGALVSVNLPAAALKTYIGVLVTIMGILVIAGRPAAFAWKKIVGLALLSAFNKGISGGGFGPVVTGGQIIAGERRRAAVGITTLAEVPICICAFAAYILGRTANEAQGRVLDMPVADFFRTMFSPGMLPWELMLALIVGATLVTPFGAFTTRALKREGAHYAIGGLMLLEGAYTMISLLG
ncbi:MAG TPA: hypothetical protein DCM87_04095 [Planctomycetes bacterium]|nr:hypothetical protein [Planctomycetota bacterium]